MASKKSNIVKKVFIYCGLLLRVKKTFTYNSLTKKNPTYFLDPSTLINKSIRLMASRLRRILKNAIMLGCL